MRIRRKKWSENELTTNEKVVHDPREYKGRWSEYFQNDAPIHLEIGCGKGRFITTLASRNPEINFIALEKQKHVICMAMRNAKEVEKNLAFIMGDVKDLAEYFDQAELSRLYINFCDPWENKKKWAKRRLTHVGFLDIYAGLLKEEGEIFFKTDNRSLFEFSLNQFCERDWKLKNISLDLHNSDYEENIMTEYEEKFSNRGMFIFRLEAHHRGKR